MNKELNEAAEKYAEDRYEELYKKQNLKEFSDTTRIFDFTDGITEGFIAGAEWQAKQKQEPTDEEINKIAEKVYSLHPTNRDFDHLTKSYRNTFIKGFKSALQFVNK